jgi:hypothetical protein
MVSVAGNDRDFCSGCASVFSSQATPVIPADDLQSITQFYQLCLKSRKSHQLRWWIVHIQPNQDINCCKYQASDWLIALRDSLLGCV